MTACPLCGFPAGRSFGKAGKRQFIYCTACTLVFVPEEYHVSIDHERERYALHDNTVENSGYVRFLSEVVEAVEPFVNATTEVLDYGSGEHAVLTHLMRKRGVRCEAFDPLYHPVVPEKPDGYDVIILCEVIEHCRNLREVIASVRELLSPEGRICIRTQCYKDVTSLPDWWYAQDLTHITFFSIQALESVARQCNRTVTVSPKKSDIYLFT